MVSFYELGCWLVDLLVCGGLTPKQYLNCVVCQFFTSRGEAKQKKKRGVVILFFFGRVSGD